MNRRLTGLLFHRPEPGGRPAADDRPRAFYLRTLLALALAPALLLAAERTAPAGKPVPARPTLAVIVSVDGLSWHRLIEYRPWYVAGLKRLLDEGQVESHAFYRHINTETGPGHASLGTGAPPRVTGIVANKWFVPRDDGSLRAVYCTDQAFPDLETGGETMLPGPGNLHVPTLGDRLVERYPEARVVSFSGKDRGAIFLAGKRPAHAVYWFDTDTGGFVSSPAYDRRSAGGSIVASIVSRFNRTRAAGFLPGRFGLLWKRLAVPEPATAESLPQPARGLTSFQVPADGLGWDHDLTKNDKGYFYGVYTSPFVDELVADLALAALDSTDLELGHEAHPDLLCLSFSAQDTVSHNYGEESSENLDVLRRLDQQLGRLFAALDRAFPKGRVVVALSADHGFAPIPEAAHKRDKTFVGGRLADGSHSIVSSLARLNRMVSEDLCLDPASRPLLAVDGFNLYYNRPSLPTLRTIDGPCGPAGRTITSADVDKALPRAVHRLYQEEIADVYLTSQRSRWPATNPVTGFVENDFDAERSGQAFLIPKPGVIFHWDPGRGSGHGSHYETETHVPLIFWGGPFAARFDGSDAAPYDLAPTLAKVLDVQLPDAVGKPLVK